MLKMHHERAHFIWLSLKKENTNNTKTQNHASRENHPFFSQVAVIRLFQLQSSQERAQLVNLILSTFQQYCLVLPTTYRVSQVLLTEKWKLSKNWMLKQRCLVTPFIQCTALAFQPLHLEKDPLELPINGAEKVRRLFTNIKRLCYKEAISVLVNKMVWGPEDR